MEQQAYIEQDFRSIVESSQDVIMRFDRDHRHLFVNQRVEEQTGIDRDDFIGKTHEELGFPEYLCEIWAEAIDYVFTNSKEHRIEFELPNGVVIDWALSPEYNDAEVVSVVTTAREITEVRHKNTLLQESQSRFKDAFKLARLATWEIDLLNAKVILNEEFCDVIGLEYKKEETTLDSKVYFEKWVHDEDKERFNTYFYSAVQSNDPEYHNILEYRINKPDGMVIWLHATIRIAINDQGVTYKAYGTSQDISYLKRTERELETHRLHLEHEVEKRTVELKKSENKLLDAIQLANLSSWEMDTSTEQLKVEGYLANRIRPKLYEEGSVINLEKYISEIDERDFKTFYSAIEKAYKTQNQNYLDIVSFRMRDVNEKIRHLNLTIKVELSSSKKLLRLYGTIQDITHIRASKSEKERLTSIVEATSDIVGILDHNRNLIYINSSGKEFYGIETFQPSSKVSEYIQGDMCSKLLESGVCNVVDGEEGQWIGENVLNRCDGQQVPVSQIVIAHRHASGDLDCYSTIIRDISEQKKIEADLKYKNNELDTFVYRVSHDLRGPIASMLGLYNVVTNEVKDPSSLTFFEMYNNQILRLNETILALIDLTRIKESDLSVETISFEGIIEGSISSFKHLKGFENADFVHNYQLEGSYRGDKSLITTIIQNLVENAIKYHRPEARNRIEIKIVLSKSDNSLIIQVSDQGRGIAEDIQSKIFNMFYRGDDTGTIGSGLGLYILKNAVDKLQGDVSIQSTLNMGSVFKVTIPYQP